MTDIGILAETSPDAGATLNLRKDRNGLPSSSSACVNYASCASPLKNDITCTRDSHVIYQLSCGGLGKNE